MGKYPVLKIAVHRVCCPLAQKILIQESRDRWVLFKITVQGCAAATKDSLCLTLLQNHIATEGRRFVGHGWLRAEKRKPRRRWTDETTAMYTTFSPRLRYHCNGEKGLNTRHHDGKSGGGRGGRDYPLGAQPPQQQQLMDVVRRRAWECAQIGGEKIGRATARAPGREARHQARLSPLQGLDLGPQLSRAWKGQNAGIARGKLVGGGRTAAARHASGDGHEKAGGGLYRRAALKKKEEKKRRTEASCVCWLVGWFQLSDIPSPPVRPRVMRRYHIRLARGRRR